MLVMSRSLTAQCMKMSKKLLVAFDFDHTIIDGNSDTIVRDILPSNEKLKKYHPSECWTNYMQRIFKLLHEEGIGHKTYLSTVAAIPPSSGILDLLHFLNRPNVEVIIISDSNSIFIDMWLVSADVRGIVKHVYTNEAFIDSSGLLNVSMHHSQSWCDVCPENLCKGFVLCQHVEKRLSEGVNFDHIAYVGDGKNDFCPSTKLSKSDNIFARKGFALEKLLQVEQEKGKNDSNRIAASVKIWDSALDIRAVLSEVLSQ